MPKAFLAAYNAPSTQEFAAIAAYFAFIGIFALVAIVFTLVVQWRIATKAGYPGAMSLLMLIPLVNFVMLILFAFSEWPIERMLRAANGGAMPPPTPTYIPPGGGGYAPTATVPQPYVPPLQADPPYGVPPPTALPPETL